MTPLLVACTFLTSILANSKDKKKLDGMDFEVKEAGLKELFAELNESRKMCRYNFREKLNFNKICENEFDCSHCFVHREFKYTNLPKQISKELVNISGFSFMPGKFYHRGHTSTEVECCGLSRIGYSPLLSELIKDASPIESLRKNDIVEQNELITIFKTENDVEIPLLSPITGEIVLVNNSNIDKDWLVIVKPFDLKKELQNLMYGNEAVKWFKYEVEDFLKTIVGNIQFAADGGEINFSEIDSLPWKEIIFNFLMSGISL